MIKVLINIFEKSHELAHPGVMEIKQDLLEVPLMISNFLQRKEVGFHKLDE